VPKPLDEVLEYEGRTGTLRGMCKERLEHGFKLDTLQSISSIVSPGIKWKHLFLGAMLLINFGGLAKPAEIAFKQENIHKQDKVSVFLGFHKPDKLSVTLRYITT